MLVYTTEKNVCIKKFVRHRRLGRTNIQRSVVRLREALHLALRTDIEYVKRTDYFSNSWFESMRIISSGHQADETEAPCHQEHYRLRELMLN